MRKLFIKISIIIGIFHIFFYPSNAATPPDFPYAGGKHRFGSRLINSNNIVLTFDDYYTTSGTPKLLELLKRYNTKATFFYNTGHNFNPASSIIQRIIKEGHILASHNHDHEAKTTTINGEFEKKLTLSILLIEKAYEIAKTNNPNLKEKTFAPYFRYPYGKKNQRTYEEIRKVSNKLYGQNCINYVFWDIDSYDWKLRNADQIFSNIKAKILGGFGFHYNHNKREITKKYYSGKFGGIILMHDMGNKYNSYEATEKVILMTKKYNLKIIPLSSAQGFRFDSRVCKIQ